jgi:hypothetical protein
MTDMQEEPKMLADSTVASLIDYVPLMPTTARRAGAAHLMSARMGENPSFLVRNPLASQLLPVGLTAAGWLSGSTLGTGLGAASFLAMQHARRKEMLDIQERYKKNKDKKRLDSAAVRALTGEAYPFFIPGFGGSKRLGATQAKESMSARRYKGLPVSSEVGDILTAASLGGYNPVAQLVDDVNAGRLRKNEDKDRWQDVEGDEIGFSDQRQGTALPYYLAAAAGTSLVNRLTQPKQIQMMFGGDRLERERWRPLVNEVTTAEKAPFLLKSPAALDAFHMRANGNSTHEIMREIYADYAAKGADPHVFVEHPELIPLLRPHLKRDRTGKLRLQREDPEKLRNAIAGKMRAAGMVSIGDRFSMAPVVAHEAGHSKIHRGEGPLKFLQDNLYPYKNLTAPLAGAGSFGVGMMTKNPWLGALAGGLTGSLIHSGTIVPEAMASVYGVRGLRNFDGGNFDNKQNTKALLAALSTYLGATTLPSILSGAAGGYLAQQRKKERERKNKK